jgi:hypothetical protein
MAIKRGKSIEQLPLLRDAQQPAIVRLDRQHPARAGRRAQRNIQHLAAGQGVGAETRGLPLVERPLRDAEIDAERACRSAMLRSWSADRPRPAAARPPWRETCVRWIHR